MRRPAPEVLVLSLALGLALSACNERQPVEPPQVAAFSWETTDASEAGFDPRELRRVEREARKAGSTCFLAVRDGEIVTEKYWNGGSADEPEQAFSVTKSVTSALVGIAEADGDLDIEEPASTYIEEWRGTDSADVTIRHLLSNDSGREWRGDDYREVRRAEDQTGYAVGLGQDDPPGEVWHYSNAAIQSLDRVISEATGTDTASYAEERLFGPLGMDDTRMAKDESGRSTTTAFGMESTCRDLARFGLLFAEGGYWEGEEIVPQAWVRASTGDVSQQLNPSYGLLWWVNENRTFVPDADPNLFAAVGVGGQIVLVDPASDTVVVRLGPRDGRYSVAQAADVVTTALTAAR